MSYYDSDQDTDEEFPRRPGSEEYQRALRRAFFAIYQGEPLTPLERRIFVQDLEQYRLNQEQNRSCARRTCDYITDYIKDLFVRFRPYPFFRGGKKRKTRRKLKKRKKKTKSRIKPNKTRRKYNRRKKIKKRRKTKRVIKGGGKKYDNLMAEIYLNRDMILGHYPKPITDQEAHSLTVATEKSMYDALPVNNDPNQDRINKYMVARKFWRPKNKNNMRFRPISTDYGSDSDTTIGPSSRASSRASSRPSSAAALAAGL
tara:strand:- start:199 stop:972 length:774 start_codon:yes stop_codon:yes gene_type:complete